MEEILKTVEIQLYRHKAFPPAISPPPFSPTGEYGLTTKIMRTNKPKWIIIHHTAANNSFESDNEWHRIKWNFKSELGFYLGYHYWIDKDGKIKQARREDREAAAVIGMNTSAIHIALRGNYSLVGDYPPGAQKIALKGLELELMKKWNIPASHIVPHRHFARTECYGLNLKNDWAQQLVAVELQKSDKEEDIKLLKKKITVIEQIIRVYVILIALLKIGKAEI